MPYKFAEAGYDDNVKKIWREKADEADLHESMTYPHPL